MSATAWLLVLAVLIVVWWVVGAVADTDLGRDIARLGRQTAWYVPRYTAWYIAVAAWHVRRLARRP